MSTEDDADGGSARSGVFSEDEYRNDAGRVIAHALNTGQAVVMRADGSPRVVISIPAAEPQSGGR